LNEIVSPPVVRVRTFVYRYPLTVPVVTSFDRATLGHAIGKGERVAVAVTDNGFANQLLKLS